jgi:hypothetical protein
MARLVALFAVLAFLVGFAFNAKRQPIARATLPESLGYADTIGEGVTTN